MLYDLLEIFTFPVCYAAYVGSQRRFYTIYRSHLQGSSSLDYLILEVGADILRYHILWISSETVL